MPDINDKEPAAKPAAVPRTFTPRVSSAYMEPGVTTRVPRRSETSNDPVIPDLDLTNYDVTMRELSHEDIARMTRIAQSPIPSIQLRQQATYDATESTAIVARSYIHHSLYGKTLQADIDTIKSHVIKSSNLSSSHSAFKQLEEILLMNRLLSLLNGARLQPMETPSNPTGYSPAQTIYIDNMPFKLQADDAQKYDYDHGRCFPYLFHAFDRSVYYLSQVGFHTQDPILVYTDMKSYFNGHAGKDISRINRQITDFKVDPNVSIQQDVVRLDDLFRELDFTMSGVMHEELKLATFMTLFQFDKRPAVESCLANLCFINGTYGQAFQSILKLTNKVDTSARHHMKSLTPANTNKKTEVCRGFAAGRCRYGDKCKYLHTGTPSPPPNANTNNTNTAKNTPPGQKPHQKQRVAGPEYISAKHRELIGPPKGQQREGNPYGLSRKQIYTLNVLTRSEGSQRNDSWADGTIINAADTGGKQTRYASLKMLRINTEAAEEEAQEAAARASAGRSSSSSSSSSALVPRPDLTSVLTSPIRHTTSASSYNFTPGPTGEGYVYRPAVAIELTRIQPGHHSRIIKHYNAGVQDSDNTGRLTDYVMYLSSLRGSMTGTPILTIFGWLDRSPSRIHSRVRPDIRSGSLDLMHVIYTLGRDYLKAIVPAMTAQVHWEPRSFMTFDPVDPENKLPDSEGSYTSTMASIETYMLTFRALRAMKLDYDMESMYTLVLIYDFMAFTAQTMRKVIGPERDGTEYHLKGIRDLMNDTLHVLTPSTRQSDPDYQLCQVFNAIIAESAPIPFENDAPWNYDGRPQKFQTPTSNRTRPPAFPSPTVAYNDISEDMLMRHASPYKKSALEKEAEGYYFVKGDIEPAFITRMLAANRPPIVPHALSPRAMRSTSSSQMFPPVDLTSDYDDASEGIHSVPATPSDESLKASLPIRPPTPPLKRKYDDMDDSDTSSSDHTANLVIESHVLNSLSKTSKVIFDSGCSISGTSNVHDLSDVTSCGPLSVQGAFGPSTQPAHRGKLGPLGLDAIVIDGMGSQTLISLSQFCQGGDSGKQYAGIFTATDFRMFELKTILPALRTISTTGTEVTRGTVQGGIYIQDS